MPALIALALSVGVLAVAATWLFLVPAAVVAAHLQVWQAFIAWGCHYHSGGKFTGTSVKLLNNALGDPGPGLVVVRSDDQFLDRTLENKLPLIPGKVGPSHSDRSVPVIPNGQSVDLALYDVSPLCLGLVHPGEHM
jgi:hypothetical protein